MAFLDQEFDASSLPKGNTNFDPLPPGWYGASITKADLTPTKDGSGQYIKVRYDITGPTHQGRVVFGNLNIKNASLKAEEIGRQQLGDIMRAIGLPKLADTDQLIGGNLQIKVSIRPATEQFEAQNEVKGFRASNGAAPDFGAGSTPSPVPMGLARSEMRAAKAAPPWAARK